ncbi:MAG: porin family protein [Spirochaetaceae bacterium]|jgi:hypothetical protein|nr:porin family protein [Spirochaetaceae bacterium]
MNRNRIKSGLAFLGLWLVVLFPLSAQNGDGLRVENREGYDYDGKAVVSILPFIGDDEAAKTFNRAVNEAVIDLQKYSPRVVSIGTVEAAGVRVPTDMPPVRELAPGARYALTGGVYPGNYEGEYYFQLWLWNMTNSTMIYTDDLVYQNIDEGLESLPGLVAWLFSHIVEVTVESEAPPEEAWKDKRISVGLRSGVSQRWYTAPDEVSPGAHGLVYEGGVFISVLLNSLLSVQGEVNFTFDNLVFRGITDIIPGEGYEPVLVNKKYTSYSLMFPLILKAHFRPGNLRLAPFAGVYAFLPLGKVSYEVNPSGEGDSFSRGNSVPLGYTLGLEIATPCGPGILLADIRYGGDFDTLTIDDGTDTAYKRRMFSVSVGYAFGFITLKK